MQAKGQPTLGSTSFAAENPPFGAVFTYYLNDVPKTSKDIRQEKEKALRKQNADAPFPGWDRLRGELDEHEPKVVLLVRDENGEPVRWVEGITKKGLHRVSWDLRFSAPDPIDLSTPDFVPPWAGSPKGPLAAPGQYTVELYMIHDGTFQTLGMRQEFTVKPVPTAPEGTDFMAAAKFQQMTSELSRQVSIANKGIGQAEEKLRYMKEALIKAPKATADHFYGLEALRVKLRALKDRLSGDPVRQKMSESTSPSISGRIGNVIYGHWDTRQPPTVTQQRNIELAQSDFDAFQKELSAYFDELTQYETALDEAGAPWTPGRKLE
jgi:hypothetical protein